jgi:hypothetical protein
MMGMGREKVAAPPEPPDTPGVLSKPSPAVE